MASTSKKPFLIPLMIFLICQTFSSSPATIPASTISAAPALLPNPPLSSPPFPALSPDITPLFPSPGGSELAPSDSSLPTIPSSLSPPNPDAMVAPGPFMPFQPSGSFPIYSAIPLASCFSAILVFAV
ncbi:classical arabinogalactan protein 26-like [Lycium barbarum]|uniref:classical arabinogalactan protein 26-like n=1 Tax=Lycium ferocissimum TaxID=112874 RepID=UPI0028165AD7|nr:classical arabinogalactan protein 26-like [Lycium ferocissimum]XP_060178395.1 classical arabinogalactan protein 26-like [Lycium barbarum]